MDAKTGFAEKENWLTRGLAFIQPLLKILTDWSKQFIKFVRVKPKNHSKYLFAVISLTFCVSAYSWLVTAEGLITQNFTSIGRALFGVFGFEIDDSNKHISAFLISGIIQSILFVIILGFQLRRLKLNLKKSPGTWLIIIGFLILTIVSVRMNLFAINHNTYKEVLVKDFLLNFKFTQNKLATEEEKLREWYSDYLYRSNKAMYSESVESCGCRCEQMLTKYDMVLSRTHSMSSYFNSFYGNKIAVSKEELNNSENKDKKAKFKIDEQGEAKKIFTFNPIPDTSCESETVDTFLCTEGVEKLEGRISNFESAYRQVILLQNALAPPVSSVPIAREGSTCKRVEEVSDVNGKIERRTVEIPFIEIQERISQQLEPIKKCKTRNTIENHDVNEYIACEHPDLNSSYLQGKVVFENTTVDLLTLYDESEIGAKEDWFRDFLYAIFPDFSAIILLIVALEIQKREKEKIDEFKDRIDEMNQYRHLVHAQLMKEIDFKLMRDLLTESIDRDKSDG